MPLLLTYTGLDKGVYFPRTSEVARIRGTLEPRSVSVTFTHLKEDTEIQPLPQLLFSSTETHGESTFKLFVIRTILEKQSLLQDFKLAVASLTMMGFESH